MLTGNAFLQFFLCFYLIVIVCCAVVRSACPDSLVTAVPLCLALQL